MDIICICALFLTYLIGVSRAEDLGYRYERYENKDCPGNNLRQFRTGKLISFDQCVEECNKEINCKSFTLPVTEEYCQLKTKACTNSELKTYSGGLSMHGIRITAMAPSLKSCRPLFEDHNHPEGENKCFTNEKCASIGKRGFRKHGRCRCMDKYTRNTVTNNCTLECISGDGRGYMGSQQFTRIGRKCLNWREMAEQPGLRMDDYPQSSFPDKSYDAAANYCRNPKGAKGQYYNWPWCYIDASDNVPFWEYCTNIAKCTAPKECISGDGRDYMGSQQFSRIGRKCLNWRAMAEQPGLRMDDYPPSSFPDKTYDEAGNYCRNPKGAKGQYYKWPWCYIDASDNVPFWEYCTNITKCTD